jgi:hypothetical protein
LPLCSQSPQTPVGQNPTAADAEILQQNRTHTDIGPAVGSLYLQLSSRNRTTSWTSLRAPFRRPKGKSTTIPFLGIADGKRVPKRARSHVWNRDLPGIDRL